MVYRQRLLSTISKTVAVPKPRPFPPSEAKRGPVVFDPEEWVLSQPPPPTALQAFAHRIGLSDSLADPAVIQQVCIHPSFVPVHQARYPHEPTPPSNSALASLGNALLGLFATEHFHATFPHLPTRVLKAVVSAYVGPLTCASVAQEIGASHLLRWDRAVSLLPIFFQCLLLIGLSLNLLVLRPHTSWCSSHRCLVVCSTSIDGLNIPTKIPHRCSEIHPFFLPQSHSRHTRAYTISRSKGRAYRHSRKIRSRTAYLAVCFGSWDPVSLD